MAEPLKHFFDAALVDRMARSISDPRFDAPKFRRLAKRGLEELELLDRGRHLMRALAASLPTDYAEAIAIVVASLDAPLALDRSNGMAPFFYLPHTMFVAEHGLASFELSMDAQHALTQRFSCEASIRPFLEHYRERTLAVLRSWAHDPSAHVRRLVSEGTRPRLPWAPRVSWLVVDPEPGLSLLELLRDDPSEYVRRSVANHLNDVAKDHPARVLEIAERWTSGEPSTERRRLVRHALRTLIKRGDRRALAIVGFAAEAPALSVRGRITPRRVPIGGEVTLEVWIESEASANVVVDLVVHYVKAGGERRPKVFKWRELALVPNVEVRLTRRLSLAQRSTRTHRPGEHRVEIQVQGKTFEVGRFVVTP
jgi:3-methyladenine DNA glycosylase AlkC